MDKLRRPLKVFLTDDSDLVRERLRTLFAILPYVEICGEADNATDAIEKIHTSQADVVILDLDLRASHGMEVLQTIKKSPDAPVVIVLSIHPHRDLASHYLEAGADHYFEKGHAIEGILNLLENLGHRFASRAV